MTSENLNTERSYRAIWNGAKGTLVYFHLYESTWAFSTDGQDPDKWTNYKKVGDAEIAQMTTVRPIKAKEKVNGAD